MPAKGKSMAVIYTLIKDGKVVYAGKASSEKNLFMKLSKHSDSIGFDSHSSIEIDSGDVAAKLIEMVRELKPEFNDPFDSVKASHNRTMISKEISLMLDAVSNMATGMGQAKRGKGGGLLISDDLSGRILTGVHESISAVCFEVMGISFADEMASIKSDIASRTEAAFKLLESVHVSSLNREKLKQAIRLANGPPQGLIDGIARRIRRSELKFMFAAGVELSNKEACEMLDEMAGLLCINSWEEDFITNMISLYKDDKAPTEKQHKALLKIIA